jgi:hypothetical protein
MIHGYGIPGGQSPAYKDPFPSNARRACMIRFSASFEVFSDIGVVL